MYEPTHQPPSLQSSAPAGHHISVDLLLSSFSCPLLSNVEALLGFCKAISQCDLVPVLSHLYYTLCSSERLRGEDFSISRSERDAARMRNEGGWDVATLRWCCCSFACACVYDGKARGSGVLRVRKESQSRQKMGTYLWIRSRYTTQRVGSTRSKQIHVICTNQVCADTRGSEGKGRGRFRAEKTHRKRRNSMYLSVSPFPANHSARQLPPHQNKKHACKICTS